MGEMGLSFDRLIQPQAWTPVLSILNLALLGLLTWGVTSEVQTGLGGSRPAAIALLVVAAVSWVTWVAARVTNTPNVVLASLVSTALAGGALAAFAPLAVAFMAVAALGAAMSFSLPVCLAVAGGGWVAMLVSVAATGHDGGYIFTALAASLAGLALGVGRRQAVERAEQMVLIGVEKERAEVERARAELLAERNHLARELHDVLAHTLSALSLQLEAFESVVGSDPEAGPAIHEQLARTRRLVHEGLDEARGAVQALREDVVPLTERLTKLCDEHHAAFSVTGSAPPLSSQITLGLYRVTQEALTNALKHAPGAPIWVSLGFVPHKVSLRIENGLPASSSSELGTSGGGYGLEGIAERLALLGGCVEAGPSAKGWKVAAEVPVES
jgi:signal transduction histidine kinase